MRYILIIFVLIILADRTVHPTSISSEYTSAEYPTIGVNAEFTMKDFTKSLILGLQNV
jgi:hypothetical protein